MEKKLLTERQQKTAIYRIIRGVQQQMQLVRWPPEKYGRLYGKRSVEQIIKEKNTNYMNPCLDLTMVTIHLLREHGFNPTCIAQELIGEHTGKPTLHFAIEVPVAEKTYTIDFPRSKTANFYEGAFDHMKSFPHLMPIEVHRLPTDHFTIKTKPFHFFGVARLRRIGARFKRVKYAHIRKAFTAMSKADHPELHATVRARPTRIVRAKKSRH